LGDDEEEELMEYVVDAVEFGVYELNWLFKLELLSLDEVTNESGETAVCLLLSNWLMS
jgi:hypothetical protein